MDENNLNTNQNMNPMGNQPVGGQMPNQMPPQQSMQNPIGQTMQSQPVQQPVQEQPMGQVQNVQNNFNNVNNTNNINNASKPKGSKKPFIIIGGLVVVLIIIALVVVINIMKNPKNVFAKALDVAKTEYKAGIEKVAGKNGKKHELNINFNIDAGYNGLEEDEEKEDTYDIDDEDEIDDEENTETKQQMEDELNERFKYYKDASLDLVLQYDENNNVQVNADYSSEAVDSLSGSLVLDSENKVGYYRLKELADKWIDANIDKESFEEMINQNLVNDIKENDSEFNKTGIDIVVNEISKALSTKDFYTANDKILVDGEETKVRKSALHLTQTEMEDLILEVLQNLKNNEEFLNSFGDERKYTENSLDSTIKDLEKSKKKSGSKENNAEYEIVIYTTGFFENEFVRFEFIMSKDNDLFTFDFVTKANYYNINVSYNVDDENSYRVNLKLKNVSDNGFDATLKGSIDTAEIYVDINADINYKVSDQTDIEKIGKNDVITSNDLTMKDYENYSKTDAAKVIPVTILPGYMEMYYNRDDASYIDDNDLNYEHHEPGEMTTRNTNNINNENVKASNSQYEAYFSNYTSAANVKALLTRIKTNNTLAESMDSYRIISIYAGGNYYKPSEIMSEISSQQYYYINVKDYDDEGYIESIEIAVAQQQ